jgi:hypothetical protein
MMEVDGKGLVQQARMMTQAAVAVAANGTRVKGAQTATWRAAGLVAPSGSVRPVTHYPGAKRSQDLIGMIDLNACGFTT